jgi:hypothetical protein
MMVVAQAGLSWVGKGGLISDLTRNAQMACIAGCFGCLPSSAQACMAACGGSANQESVAAYVAGPRVFHTHTWDDPTCGPRANMQLLGRVGPMAPCLSANAQRLLAAV